MHPGHANPKRPATHHAGYSVALAVPALIAFGGGLAAGVGVYVIRRDEIVAHDPSTNAITAHIVLAVVLVIGVGVYWLRSATRPDPFAPIGRRAAARIRITAKAATRNATSALRAFVGVLLGALMLYLAFRIGMQVTAGWAPAFVTNAWGGPTVVGAFLAHSIDAAAITILCAAAMNRILLDNP